MVRTLRWGPAAVAALLFAQIACAAAHRPSISVAAHPAPFRERAAQCAGKEGWSDPAPPVRIFGGIYDIGTCGITVLLIAGPAGHIVIDAATAEAAPSIVANIGRLGFRPADVKLLLSSHEHVDHAGGLRMLQERTGAKLIATALSQKALESGASAAADPQQGSLPDFAGVRVDRIVGDGEVVALGPLRLTAHVTPGHAPGSTSWSWTSRAGGAGHAVVYADSLSAVSSAGYRFGDHASYVATFRTSIVKIARLPCDLIITPHPGASNLYARLAGAAPLFDRSACAAYAAAGAAKLDQRLADEEQAPRKEAESPRR